MNNYSVVILHLIILQKKTDGLKWLTWTPDLGLEPRTSRLEVLRSIQLSQPGNKGQFFRSSDNSFPTPGIEPGSRP
uniref:Uncharacterized protein n=1 Tax=viral metagenome TaxID=1070528 RepID=A0A6C0I4X3_9ZZZZ